MILRSTLLLIAATLAAPVAAQDLVYSPTNPSFGGNPLNSSHLLGIASAQREATARDADDGRGGVFGPTPSETGRDNAELFVRQLEGRLFSALAGQVTEAIFGDDPQQSGSVTFGSTTIEFDRTTEAISLVITDTLDGTVTEIVVPQLVTSGSP